MTGQAVIRTLFVIVLMITAHTIKPFSLSNLTTHMLGAARSFSFALPEAAVARIDHVNYLALAVGIGTAEQLAAPRMLLADEGLLAYLGDDAQLEPSAQSGRGDKKAKSVKRSAPAKRVVREEKAGKGDLSRTRQTENWVRVVDLPEVVAAENVNETTQIAAQTISASYAIDTVNEAAMTSAFLSPNFNNCDTVASNQTIRVIALFDQKRRLHLIPQIVNKGKDADCKSAIQEVQVESVTVGPEELVEETGPQVVTPKIDFETQSVESMSRPLEICPFQN